MPAKTFNDVQTCCKKKCYSKIDIAQQKSMFEKYWPHDITDKSNQYMVQSTILDHMIDMPDTLKERQRLDWNYSYILL